MGLVRELTNTGMLYLKKTSALEEGGKGRGGEGEGEEGRREEKGKGGGRRGEEKREGKGREVLSPLLDAEVAFQKLALRDGTVTH